VPPALPPALTKIFSQRLDRPAARSPRGPYGAIVNSVTVWLNGTHGAGKTTTSALVQQLIPDSRAFDAEKDDRDDPPLCAAPIR
jgi:hypothetical protein